MTHPAQVASETPAVMLKAARAALQSLIEEFEVGGFYAKQRAAVLRWAADRLLDDAVMQAAREYDDASARKLTAYLSARYPQHAGRDAATVAIELLAHAERDAVIRERKAYVRAVADRSGGNVSTDTPAVALAWHSPLRASALVLKLYPMPDDGAATGVPT